MMRMLLVLLFIVGCASGTSDQSKVKLTILHTNDHHGHYLPDSKGQYGMAARSTLLKKLRKDFQVTNTEHLLLSGGDINTGTMESDLFDAEPDFLGMKELGYDAMAVGNHEFDNATEVLLKQSKIAGFPFLAANIFYKGTDKRLFEKFYLIKKYKNIKIGIFGLTTTDTPFKASHQHAKSKFYFKNIIDSAREAVKILKEKEKVDYIIVLTHVGHHGSLTSNGDVKLAKAVDGIDVIVGGHSQEIINAEHVNNTIIVQAEDWGKYLGRLDLELTKTKMIQKNYQLIPINLKVKKEGKYVLVGEKIEHDAKMEKLFKPYELKAQKLGKKILGVLDRTLSGARTKVRQQQMPIAQFMGAALRYKLKEVEVAILNGGSIRDTLKAGKISRKDLHNLHPYGNTIVSVKLKPKDFFDYIDETSKINLIAKKISEGANPHYINMKIFYKNNKLYKITAKDNSWSVTKDQKGQVVSNKKSFILGTMNFLARGGDNYPKIISHPSYVDSGFMINTAMMEYLEAKKKVKAKTFEKLAMDILNF